MEAAPLGGHSSQFWIRVVLVREYEHGELLWGSGFLLAIWLAQSGYVKGQRVLEVGSGLGQGGFAASAHGATEVVLTDRSGPVLNSLRRNVALNMELSSTGRRPVLATSVVST